MFYGTLAAASSLLLFSACAVPTTTPLSAEIGAYSRSEFGPGLTRSDPDGNGCDTRNDVLQRDLVAIDVADDGCTVLEGILSADPYTGQTVAFVRGTTTSREVQIDHIYALRDAWDDGAAEWSPERRAEFANDPFNLIATAGRVNASKGAEGPATWSADVRAEARCPYLQRYLLVATEYGLELDDEQQAFAAAEDCGLGELTTR